MSAGSIWLKLPSSPSISTSAPWLAPKVPIPRTQNSEMFFPGSPLFCREIIPGTRPPNMLGIEVAGVCRSFTSTFVMAPTTLTFRCEPSPTTTVSSSVFVEGFSLNCAFFRSSLESILTSCFS